MGPISDLLGGASGYFSRALAPYAEPSNSIQRTQNAVVTPQGRQQAAQNMLRMLQDAWGAISAPMDAYTGKRLKPDTRI